MTTTWNDRFLGHWAESDEPAVITPDLIWSGRELVARAAGAANWLAAHGFAPGDAVPAVVDETPAAVALAVGATLSGRPLAALGTKLPAGDLASAVAGLGAEALVTTPDLADHAGAAAARCGATVHVLADEPAPGPPLDVEQDPEDVAFIVHTSGTTGAPKPVAVRHRPLLARCEVYGQVIPMGPGDRYCSAAPFHHTAGVSMVYTVLGRGCAVVPQAVFSTDGWRTAGRLGVTVALLVPTMIDIMLAEGTLGAASPRYLQYGAAPIHPDTLTAALEALPRTQFVQIFGQTEMSPFTSLSHADHQRALEGRPELLTSVGRPVPGVDVRVEDRDGSGVGELTFRGPHAFVTDADGWRRSGDLGTVDSEGYIRIVNRKDDKIVRGGENIYPAEVEAAVLEHPGVREVAVLGVPDKRWGEIVVAAVVPADPTAAPTQDELRTHTRDRIAHFKVPVAFEMVEALPRNASGKVLRRELVR